MAKTRYVVRPQPRLQKLQRDIRKQFGTYKSTYLAKVDGAVRLPGGYFWVHDATGTDANGNTTYGAARKLLMLPGATVFPRPNTKVDVVTIHGIDYIARTNSHELERMGVDPHQSNTLDPVAQYKALDFIINLQGFKTPGASSTHIIGSIYKKPNGEYAVFPTTGGYDFVTANVPSTDNQVVVCQWVNTDTNAIAVTVSSEESRDTDLKHPDNLATTISLINECVAAAPTNHIGVNAWRIFDDSTISTIDDNNKLADLRGIVGAGSAVFTVAGDSGTSQTVTSGDTLTIAGGVGLASVASATDTITLNLDVNSLTADATPDGAADYVATWDASASAHKKVLLDNLPGGGGGANTALSNLASVAVNTSLISDTDNTDDLGSSATKWKTTYSTNVVVEEQAAPSTPASGDYIVYAKTDGKLYGKNDAGTEHDLTAGGTTAAAHSYVGYNTAGGSTETMTLYRQYMTKVTLSSDGFIMNVGAYIKPSSAGNVMGFAVAVMSDNAGTPNEIISHTAWRAGYDVLLDNSYSWVSMPTSVWCTAGDYWLAFMDTGSGGSRLHIAYDGSGADKYYAVGNAWMSGADGGYTATATTKKYSIRASVLTL
jgi:hypothetical protein